MDIARHGMSLDQSFKCLETAVSDATRTLIRSINTEWQKVKQYKETVIIKEDEILAGKERVRHLKESENHVGKHLRGTKSQIESLKKSNEELKKNINRLRREEEKVSKEYDKERERLDEKLVFYKEKWQERYEVRYANKPLVKEHEKAQETLADITGKLKHLKSSLRECQADIFKAKCERGKRNAEESGFYPLESFIIRIASVGIEVIKSEAADIRISKEISYLQHDIDVSKKILQAQSRNSKSLERITKDSTQDMEVCNSENRTDNTLTGRDTSDKAHPVPQKPMITQNDCSGYKNVQQPPVLQSFVNVPLTESSKQSVQEGKVRNRIEKLKLYTPTFFSPPNTQCVNISSYSKAVNQKVLTRHSTSVNHPKRNFPDYPVPRKVQIRASSSFSKNTSSTISSEAEAKTTTPQRALSVQKVHGVSDLRKTMDDDSNKVLQKDQILRSSFPTALILSEGGRNKQNKPCESNVSPVQQGISKQVAVQRSLFIVDQNNSSLSEAQPSKETQNNHTKTHKTAVNLHTQEQYGNLKEVHQQMQVMETENTHQLNVKKCSTDLYVERKREETLLQQVEKESVINSQQVQEVNASQVYKEVPSRSVYKNYQVTDLSSEDDERQEACCINTENSQKNVNLGHVQEGPTRLEKESIQQEINCNNSETSQLDSVSQGEEQGMKEKKYAQVSRSIVNVNEGVEKSSSESLRENSSMPLQNQSKIFLESNPSNTCGTRPAEISHYFDDNHEGTVFNREFERETVRKTPEKHLDSKVENRSSSQIEREVANCDSKSQTQEFKSLSQKSHEGKETFTQPNAREITNSRETEIIPEGLTPNEIYIPQNIPSSSRSSPSSGIQYLTARSSGELSNKMQTFNSPATFTEVGTPSAREVNIPEAVSPFDFEKHMNALGAIKQSPKFIYQSRHMYKPPEESQEAIPQVSTETSKNTVFNAMSFFHGSTEIKDANSKTSEPQNSKTGESDFLSFAFDDYLIDSPSPPEGAGKEKAMFSFGDDSSKAVKSPGFFPLFAADTQESNKDAKSDFVLNFGGKANSPDETPGFKFLF